MGHKIIHTEKKIGVMQNSKTEVVLSHDQDKSQFQENPIFFKQNNKYIHVLIFKN